MPDEYGPIQMIAHRSKLSKGIWFNIIFDPSGMVGKIILNMAPGILISTSLWLRISRELAIVFLFLI